MRYLLTVIAFIMGFSALPVWAMNCYAEHEGVEIPLSLVTYQESLSPAMVKKVIKSGKAVNIL